MRQLVRVTTEMPAGQLVLLIVHVGSAFSLNDVSSETVLEKTARLVPQLDGRYLSGNKLLGGIRTCHMICVALERFNGFVFAIEVWEFEPISFHGTLLSLHLKPRKRSRGS